MSEMKRFQIDVTPSQAERYDALVEQCELGSRRELFNAAMTLFNWAVTEVRRGRSIASYEDATDQVEKIVHPALESARTKKAELSWSSPQVAARPADPSAHEQALKAVENERPKRKAKWANDKATQPHPSTI